MNLFCKEVKKGYTLAEVIIVMLIIAVVVSISIKIAKVKLAHITSYTYYSAFSTVRKVSTEMLNEFNPDDETQPPENLLTKLFMNKAYCGGTGSLNPDATFDPNGQIDQSKNDADKSHERVDFDGKAGLDGSAWTKPPKDKDDNNEEKKEEENNDPDPCRPQMCPDGKVFDTNRCECVCESGNPGIFSCGMKWDDDQCRMVRDKEFDTNCPKGKIFVYSACECQNAQPHVPFNGAEYCKLFVSYSNTSQFGEECAGDAVTSGTTNFKNIKHDIVLRNGMIIYNASKNPVKIPLLKDNNKGNKYVFKKENNNNITEDVTINLDEYGYILYIDIDGERSGNGVLWEDVFPFYVTLSGITIPAFKTDAVEEFGGGNKAHLQVSLQDEFVDNSGRHIVWRLKSRSFRESACKMGYIADQSEYCKATPQVTTMPICKNLDHDCHLKYVSPYSLFKK